MAKKSQKRSTQNKAKKVKDLPIGPAQESRAGRKQLEAARGQWFVFGSTG